MSKPTHQIVVAPMPTKKTPVKREIQVLNGKPEFVEVSQTVKVKTEKEEPTEKIKYINPNVSRRIIEARTRLGLNQLQFAQKAGINVNVLKSYENGTVVPSSLELQKLSAVANENFRKAKIQ